MDQQLFGAIDIGDRFVDARGFQYTKINQTQARVDVITASAEPKAPMVYEFDANDRVIAVHGQHVRDYIDGGYQAG